MSGADPGAILGSNDLAPAAFDASDSGTAAVIALVIPTLGGSHLANCLETVTALNPAPDRITVVSSGGSTGPTVPDGIKLVHRDARLGFASAVNLGIARSIDDAASVALLNDDAVPEPAWLGRLQAALAADPGLAAVQGTVTDAEGETIDGRGIAFDSLALPVQVDRGSPPVPEPDGPQTLIAVSGTASLFRAEALRATSLGAGVFFDPSFGSYYEDLDLGLRLRRLGWRAAWVPRARVAHLGSATGRTRVWRHPWWLLSNRWRAIAGNLSTMGFSRCLPRMLRGEIRAVHTLARDNLRALPVAAAVLPYLPFVVLQAITRASPGPRLAELPEVNS
jgi:GT2 family glycosyltransferase